MKTAEEIKKEIEALELGEKANGDSFTIKDHEGLAEEIMRIASQFHPEAIEGVPTEKESGEELQKEFERPGMNTYTSEYLGGFREGWETCFEWMRSCMLSAIKGDAIGFAEWKGNDWALGIDGLWRHKITNAYDPMTTSELYSLYQSSLNKQQTK